MQLGNFSISLSVKNLQASKDFYLMLGFSVHSGHEEQGWLVLRNGSCTIGLFQGMFDKNILTFNPGWNEQAEPLDEFTDVRSLQKSLKAKGVSLASEADESSTGPASFTLLDPDDNPILIDQHV